MVPKLLLESVDRAWVAVVPMLLALAVKVPMSWALIHGHGGLPFLGLTGAGLVSFLATAFGAVLRLGPHIRLAASLRPW